MLQRLTGAATAYGIKGCSDAMQQAEIERLFQMAVERIADPAVRESVAQDRSEVPSELLKEDSTDEQSEERTAALTTLIKEMSVAQRIKLALFGNLAARTVLLRDTNKQIPLLVLENPRLTENEVVEISRNTQLDDGVLRALGNNSQWMKNYALKINLVSNPKTPIDIAMKWLKFIKDKDLQRLARSKNLSQVIATQSRKLLEQREK